MSLYFVKHMVKNTLVSSISVNFLFKRSVQDLVFSPLIHHCYSCDYKVSLLKSLMPLQQKINCFSFFSSNCKKLCLSSSRSMNRRITLLIKLTRSILEETLSIADLFSGGIIINHEENEKRNQEVHSSLLYPVVNTTFFFF